MKKDRNKIGQFLKGHEPKYKGKKMPKWVGIKVGLAKTGFRHSEESKRKISLAHMGKTTWNKDKKLSKKHRDNLSKNSSRFWLNKKRPEVERRKLEGSYKGTNKIGYRHTKKAIEKMRVAALSRPPQKYPFKNTFIELKLQNLLRENNIPFETHYPILGHPDIFIKPNICIFADGCYWHGCPKCKPGHNEHKRLKDKRITKELQSQGYTVIRLWEHDIKKDKVEQLNNLISTN